MKVRETIRGSTCTISKRLTLEGLDEHVQTLVTVLITTSGEEVKSVLKIKIVMTIKVTTDKVVNALLGNGMQVLELVHGRELDNVQTVRQNTIRLALQQMLGLVGSDVGDGRKDITAVCCSTLDAVTVVDATLAGLVVNIEGAEVVVEIDGAGAEVTAEQGGVGREDGRDVDVTLAAERNTDSGKPFVEVGNHCRPLLMDNKLISIAMMIEGD